MRRQSLQTKIEMANGVRESVSVLFRHGDHENGNPPIIKLELLAVGGNQSIVVVEVVICLAVNEFCRSCLRAPLTEFSCGTNLRGPTSCRNPAEIFDSAEPRATELQLSKLNPRFRYEFTAILNTILSTAQEALVSRDFNSPRKYPECQLTHPE